MVIDCIDYMFGGDKPPFAPSQTGFDEIGMTLANDEGEGITVRRRIESNGAFGKKVNRVEVDSSVEGIESKRYYVKKSKGHPEATYGDILMELIGVDGRHKIIATSKRVANLLTPRSFFHMLCLKEKDIIKEKSVIESTESFPSSTTSIDALAFLLYEGGQALEDIEKPEIASAKKDAVLAYINSKFSGISERSELLRNEIAGSDAVDAESKIDEVLGKSAEFEEKIAAAQAQMQKTAAEIAESSERLEEGKVYKERYRKLHTQYESDISRLAFIIDGEENNVNEPTSHCPFCDSPITSKRKEESYHAAAQAEMETVIKQLTGLTQLEDRLEAELEEREVNLRTLQSKQLETRKLIEAVYTPALTSLKSELEKYRSLIEIRKELDLLASLEKSFKDDYSEKQDEQLDKTTYDAKEAFREDHFSMLSASVNSAIKRCNYPGFRTARLSRQTFDVVVNGKNKGDEGKGYRAFLNAIFSFVLMKHTEKHGMHAPMLLVLDSPINPLRENDDMPISDSMKGALLSFMSENVGSCQVIIAENDIPEGIDYGNMNIIEFHKDSGEGRYGFLEGFTGDVEQVDFGQGRLFNLNDQDSASE